MARLAPMNLLSVAQLTRLLVIVVGFALVVSFGACETAQPTPVEPSPVPSPTAAPEVRVEPTVTPTPVPTEAPQPTLTSTATPTPTQTPEPIPTSTLVPTNTPEPTPTSTLVPTSAPEPTATTAATKVPTHTPTPAIVAPTSTPTHTPTHTPTSTPEPTETPSPTVTSTPEPTPTSEPTPTPTAEPTVASTPTAEVSAEDVEPTVDAETLWSEYFETLDEVEVSCIHLALDEDDYDSMLERKVVSGQRVTDRHELEIWGCLTQENAVDLYLSAFYTFRPDGDRTDDELAEIDACHRSLLQYADIARYLELLVTDIDTRHWRVRRNLTLTSSILAQCWIKEQTGYIPYSRLPVYEARPINFVPDEKPFWHYAVNEILEEERDCIRNEIGSDDYEALLAKAIFDGKTESSDVAVWGCLGKDSAVGVLRRTTAFDFLGYYGFLRRGLDTEGNPCIDRLLDRMDFPRLIAAGLPDVGLEDYRHGVAAIIGFGLCFRSLPLVVELDDHSDETREATEIAIGSFIEGNLDAKFGAESDEDVF